MLSGLCFKSKFDAKYSWTKDFVNGYYSFRGYSDTDFVMNDNKESWSLQLISNPNITAEVNSTDYPFGLMKWTIRNEPCYDETERETWLSINSCSQGDFNCDNGQCIGMADRCNGRIDCDDKSGN